MKRLLLALLAAISFSIPVFANHSPSFSHKSPIGEIHPWIAPIVISAIVLLGGLVFLTPNGISQEEEETWAREKKLIRKEKLISYGHDMKVLEEVFREIEIEEDEDEDDYDEDEDD